MKKVHIKLRFTDPILGMSPADDQIYTKFIATRNPNGVFNDELEAIEAAGEKAESMTIFPCNKDGDPILWDYQIRGFFKDACRLLSYVKGVDETTGKRSKKRAATLSGGLSAYQKVIDGNIFVSPRQIVIHHTGGIGLCERPLRAMTAQGERIALACSEEIQAGAWIEFDVTLYNDLDVDLLLEWLTYGRDHGLGQWRNSGKGRFLVEECVVSDIADPLKPYFEVKHA